MPTPSNITLFHHLWLTPTPATPHEWTTPVLRGPGRLAAATPELRARKPKGTPENSPVSFSRLPEVGTPCGHVYAVRRRPPVTCVVLGVFEVRVRRAESRGRDPGEPDADGPKGGCLQDTPENINACSFQQPNGPFRWKPRFTDYSDGTGTNGPLRWIPRTRMSKNDRRVVRTHLLPNTHHGSHRQPLPNPPTLTIPSPTMTRTTKPIIYGSPGHHRCPLGYPGPHPPPSSHGVRVCG